MDVDDSTMLNLNDLRFFVRAVEAGSFTGAARRLGVPKSTVSKRVAELEAALGAKLIERSSRSFRLSELGQGFFTHASAALIEAETAAGLVQRRLAAPSGPVRITASLPVCQLHLAGVLPRIALAYPKLRLEVHATDRFVDLIQEGFDIALRSHAAPLADSTLTQRRLAEAPVVAVAAPAYLAANGHPCEPADLAGHAGLLTGPQATVWRLVHEDGREAHVEPRPVMILDESTMLIEA
ncbi:LysR substrate-binding domain-containing protein, partial [Geminicoccus flavidas]|uniref:LysR substrate-binding domain-containing protein n=1 Tax=Geminicoccus flavidas TaxID=2506407 RepID=UPI00135A6BFD